VVVGFIGFAMLVDFDVVLVVEVVGFAVDTEVGNVPVLYPQ
jgi:hypothetical protein